jgi:hypothetical protein
VLKYHDIGMANTKFEVLYQPVMYIIFVSTNNYFTMTKIASNFSWLLGKLPLLKSRNKSSIISIVPTNKRKTQENNGERWLHVLPETGESYLAISLYQFELERARALALA